MHQDDETDPIVPDPPFSITLGSGRYQNVLIVPGWNPEFEGAEFEVYSGNTLLARIRRNPYDIEGWHAFDGDLTHDEENEIGDQIDKHYLN